MSGERRDPRCPGAGGTETSMGPGQREGEPDRCGSTGRGSGGASRGGQSASDEDSPAAFGRVFLKKPGQGEAAQAGAGTSSRWTRREPLWGEGGSRGAE